MPYARKDFILWQPGMYYHIYNRGARQLIIFREPTNFLFTIEKIKEYSRDNQISIIAYCLMPTHYHFLARQDGDKPASNLPQFTFNSYSKAYNLRYSHSGTLFEGRFRAKAIVNSSHLLHLCRYIHGNPVKDGLVADPADWLASGKQAFCWGMSGLVDQLDSMSLFRKTERARPTAKNVSQANQIGSFTRT